MADQNWTFNDIPDQHGKIAIVTGGNSGIGYEAARALAHKGAHVLLAARNLDKGNHAAQKIRHESPHVTVEVVELDLASLADIKRFAQEFLRRELPLNLLLNNAGVMALPYHKTADGFEVQFGTNHLGHFALTGYLLPAILAAPQARVVTVSSNLHKSGKIEFDNLDGSKSYDPWAAYGESKLANLLFAYELQRKLAASGATAISVACHPGYAATNLQKAGPEMSGDRLRGFMMNLANKVVAQSPHMGALPTLYAATAPGVIGCDYIGPTGMGGMRGHPAKLRSNDLSYNEPLAQKLWTVSEQLTTVHYAFANAVSPAVPA